MTATDKTPTRPGLAEKTLFGTVDKVEDSIRLMRLCEPSEGYWLAFSGGKDSVVLKHLADLAGVKYDAHYGVTTIDPPELVRFIKEYHPEVAWERHNEPFLIRMAHKGFPTRVARWCCGDYKEQGGSGRIVMTGIRSAESNRRSSRRPVEQCYSGNKTYLHAIFNWTDTDVWDFIRAENIPYCSLYDEGFKRLGCLFCPNQTASQKARDRLRWPRYAEQFRRAFHKLWDNRQAKGNDSMSKRWKTADDAFEWWMSNDPLPPDNDDGGLFT